MRIIEIVGGVLQWTMAIVAVIGTLVLFTWFFVLIVRKDKPK